MIDELLEKLEDEHQDELEMVYQFELEYFSTRYLEEIHHKWLARCNSLRLFHQRMVLLGAFSPVWLIIGIIGLVVLEDRLISMFIIFFPIFMFVSIGGMVHLYLRYGGLKRQEDMGEIIKDELRRRRRQLFC